MTKRYNSEVFTYCLNGDGTGNLIDSEKESKAIWAHGDFAIEDCPQWLGSLNVPESIIESLVRAESRPRALSSGQGILLNLRALNMNPNKEPEDMVSLRFWIEKNRLISVRQRVVYSIQDIRNALDEGCGPTSLPAILVALIERIADRISEFVDKLEDQLDVYEDHLDTFNSSDARSEINHIKRQAITVRRYLAPQREALESLHYLSKGIIEESMLYLLHEQSDRIVRYLEDLDLVRERTQVLQEELTNRVAQEQNARMYVLSIVAAVFLPISFVTGLFGMNVGGLPWMDSSAGFLIVSGLMASVSIGSIIYFRYKKWL